MDGLEEFGPELFKELNPDLVNLLIGVFCRARSEFLVQILLDSNDAYVGAQCISSGTGRSAKGRYRVLFESVWAAGASGFVLLHNHPSGCVNPSIADLITTKHVAALCKALEVRFVDHLIVTNRQVFSIGQSKGFVVRQC